MAYLARNHWHSIRGAALPAAAFIIVAFFAGYALFGSNGVLAWGEYSRRLDLRRAELLKLEEQKAVLQNRVQLLDPRHADPDLVDELTRSQLGVVNPDDVIVPLNNEK